MAAVVRSWRATMVCNPPTASEDVAYANHAVAVVDVAVAWATSRVQRSSTEQVCYYK